MLNSLLLAVVVGVWWGVVHFSQPYKVVTKWLGFDQFKLFQCVTCSGFWAGLLVIGVIQPEPLSIIWAGVAAFVANETNRRLWI
jgi:hypothetical protein